MGAERSFAAAAGLAGCREPEVLCGSHQFATVPTRKEMRLELLKLLQICASSARESIQERFESRDRYTRLGSHDWMNRTPAKRLLCEEVLYSTRASGNGHSRRGVAGRADWITASYRREPTHALVPTGKRGTTAGCPVLALQIGHGWR
jgi:hypothetical protein